MMPFQLFIQHKDVFNGTGESEAQLMPKQLTLIPANVV